MHLRQGWIKTREEREVALARKHVAGGELWSRGVRNKDHLKIGDIVSVQQMTGRQKGHWILSGTVVDNDGPDSVWIKLDGSGKLTKRGRQHVKLIVPFL